MNEKYDQSFQANEIDNLRETMEKAETINDLHRKIQVLTTQVNAYRKRLNKIEPCITLGTRPCPDCGKPLLSYCPRCDR